MSNRQKAISKKFGRKRDQRTALIKSLAESLILDETIKTTLPKAKAVARYTEKLLTKAKKSNGSLANRRAVISSLHTIEAAHKLVDEIAPKLEERQSGYFRVEKLGDRRGDNARMAQVSFVDNLKSAKKSQKKQQQTTRNNQQQEKEKTGVAPEQPVIKDSESKIQPKMTTQAPKRSGVRGNR